MLRALLCDFGGTLLPDIGERRLTLARRRAWAAAIVPALPDLDPSARLALVDEIYAALLASQAGLIEHAEELIAGVLGPKLASEASEVRRLLASVRGPARLYSGACELLEVAGRLGLRRVVVSNAALLPGDVFWERLDQLGLAGEVDGLVSSYDVGYRKPHQAMFEAALRVAGCPAEGCVMVGDSEEKDIAPARAIGMKTIRVCIPGPRDRSSTADEVVDSLEAVAVCLQSFSSSQYRREVQAKPGSYKLAPPIQHRDGSGCGLYESFICE